MKQWTCPKCGQIADPQWRAETQDLKLTCRCSFSWFELPFDWVRFPPLRRAWDDDKPVDNAAQMATDRALAQAVRAMPRRRGLCHLEDGRWAYESRGPGPGCIASTLEEALGLPRPEEAQNV